LNILVTGGAGYIGSHTVRVLKDKGYNVVVYDNFVKSSPASIQCKFVKGALSDKEIISNAIRDHQIEAVIHFAGFIEAGESMKDPSKFFKNNLDEGINLLDAMVKNDVKKIIFSSSAAVYEPSNLPLKESDIKSPKNFYGETKLMFEKLLSWYDQIYAVKSISLRYFNAAGAGFGLGEDHTPETHLIPLILKTALGQREKIEIYGIDYETEDGTCVRDYIHVLDLAEAHALALENISNESKVFNVGTGKGHSVKEVIAISEEVTGRKINVVESARREGDPKILVASSEKIKNEFGWIPKFGMRDIIKSAWEWHSNNPEGFNKNIARENHD